MLRLTAWVLPGPIKCSISESFHGAVSVNGCDADGDGDMDVLGAAMVDNEIAWWENTDGSGISFLKHTIETGFFGAMSVISCDIDGDGDSDVLGAARGADEIAWWENTDGTGSLWTKNTVSTDFDGAFSVYAIDVDGDTDKDVLGAAVFGSSIAWWENIDGTGSVWTEHNIEDDFQMARSVFAGDMDGDGDNDVLGAGATADEIAWWENTQGTGTVWVKHPVDDSFSGAGSVHASDVDGDGDLDVLGAGIGCDDVIWWENTDGTGSTWTEHLIDDNFIGANSVYASDVDGDGDSDVLGAAGSSDEVAWWENADGSGTSWTKHTVDDAFDYASSVFAADVDGDGFTDVLGAANFGDELAWWRIGGFMDQGVLESSVLDAGSVEAWDTFSSVSTEPAGTSVGFQFRSSSDASQMGDWSDTVFESSVPLAGILTDSTSYLQYRVLLHSDDPANTPELDEVMFSFDACSGIEESGSTYGMILPDNPSWGALTVLLTLPESGMVELRVYDTAGRVAAGISNEFSAGVHSVSFQGLSRGVYFCLFRRGGFTVCERAVLL